MNSVEGIFIDLAESNWHVLLLSMLYDINYREAVGLEVPVTVVLGM